jgi:hypothetical protein
LPHTRMERSNFLRAIHLQAPRFLLFGRVLEKL